jgi:hypothetical protein
LICPLQHSHLGSVHLANVHKILLVKTEREKSLSLAPCSYSRCDGVILTLSRCFPSFPRCSDHVLPLSTISHCSLYPPPFEAMAFCHCVVSLLCYFSKFFPLTVFSCGPVLKLN